MILKLCAVTLLLVVLGLGYSVGFTQADRKVTKPKAVEPINVSFRLTSADGTVLLSDLIQRFEGFPAPTNGISRMHWFVDAKSNGMTFTALEPTADTFTFTIPPGADKNFPLPQEDNTVAREIPVSVDGEGATNVYVYLEFFPTR
jgi:hypothetical protein